MYETEHPREKLFVMRPGGHDIKKVVDFRLDNGKRYYKVKWESSWEPEDNLVDYQVFLDQFWDFVNRVKSDQNLLNQPQRKKPRIIVTDGNNHIKSTNTKYISNTREQQADNDANLHYSNSSAETINTENDQIENGFYSRDSLRTTNLQNLSKTSSQILIIKTEDNEMTPERPTMVGGLPEKYSPTRSTSNSRNAVNSDFNMQLKQEDEKNMSLCDKKTHQCPQCGKIFKRRDVMIRHERTHTNNFCYFCSCCGRGFMRRYVLLKHLKREHNTEDQTKVLSTKVSKISSSPDVFIGYGSEVTLTNNLGSETDVYKYIKNRNLGNFDDFIQSQPDSELNEDDNKYLSPDEEESDKIEALNQESKQTKHVTEEHRKEIKLFLPKENVQLPEHSKNEVELFVLESLSVGENEEENKLEDEAIQIKTEVDSGEQSQREITISDQNLLIAMKREKEKLMHQDLNSK